MWRRLTPHAVSHVSHSSLSKDIPEMNRTKTFLQEKLIKHFILFDAGALSLFCFRKYNPRDEYLFIIHIERHTYTLTPWHRYITKSHGTALFPGRHVSSVDYSKLGAKPTGDPRSRVLPVARWHVSISTLFATTLFFPGRKYPIAVAKLLGSRWGRA